MRFKEVAGGTKEVWPMLLNLGEGYGSIRSTFKFRDILYTLKIYPLLVHALKSTSGKMQVYDVTTLFSLRKRETTYLNRLDKLANFPRTKLGGLRVELTVKAPTLQEAYHRVSSTPLLNLNEYLTPTSPDMEPLQLEMKLIRRSEYLSFCRDTMGKAQKAGVFKGDNNRKPGPMRKQIIHDLYNAMGWNPGTRPVTLYKPLRRVVQVAQPSREVAPPFTRASRPTTEVQRPSNPTTQIISIPWWERTFVGDVDAPPQALGTSLRGFNNPLSVEANLREIERCVKIYKRGSLWRFMTLDEDGKPATGGSEEGTKDKVVKFIWQRFKRDWHKHCYLLSEPFSSQPEVVHPPAVASDLDQELQKFNLPDETSLPASVTLGEVWGTSTLKISHKYIQADGNCQFRALAWAKYGNQGRHKVVRRKVVEYLEAHPDVIEPLLGSDVISPQCKDLTTATEYITKMAQVGTWGDDATLSAASQALNLHLVIINKDSSYFKVEAATLNPGEVQWKALFYTGDHYEVVIKQEL